MSDRPPIVTVASSVIPWLRRLHRWLGLALAAPLLIMGMTGFILVISPPLADLMLPRAPVVGTAMAEATDDGAAIAAILRAAQSAAASGLVPTRYRAGETVRVDLGYPAQPMPAVRVFIDPATRAVLRVTTQPDRFYHFVHSLHESLLLPAAFGRGIIGWFGIGLVCLSLIGIPIWWPRSGRWTEAVRVSRHATRYLFQRQLHGAGAIWIVAMLLLQGFSGASMAFPQTFRMVFGSAANGTRVAGARNAVGARHDGMPMSADQDAAIERLVREAHAAVPDAALIDLRLPTVPGRPFAVVLLPKGRAAGTPAAVVTLDPSSLRVIGVQDPRTEGRGVRFVAWLRALHSGEGLGPAWRVAVGVLGLMLPLLSVTGVAMWTLRRRSRRRWVRRRHEATCADGRPAGVMAADVMTADVMTAEFRSTKLIHGAGE
jgi:uncharacterized iron-regulated membrane protein